MALLSDIRRVFRSQSRIKSLNKELRRVGDSLSIIARGLAVIVERDYHIDLYAPPVMVDAKDEATVSYTSDREQVLREAEEQLARELGQTRGVDQLSEFERLLDEVDVK
jgi:hypothetical protein